LNATTSGIKREWYVCLYKSIYYEARWKFDFKKRTEFSFENNNLR
jgi:hypothetical protein